MEKQRLTVALTGATGFVGRHVAQALTDAGHSVRALVRTPGKLATAANLTAVEGDLFNQASLDELVKEADAVVHLVGIIAEKPQQGQTFDRVHVTGTKNLLAAAQKAGVKRWVQMSALGTRHDAVSGYHQTKWRAEEAVRSAGMDWTIFRPSIIHGPDGEFMQLVKQFWTGLTPPFVPYFAGGAIGEKGAGKLQPVWVEDVARCFAGALTNPESVGETYPLGGPDPYSWPDLYAVCKRHIPGARNKRIVAIPAWLAKLMAAAPGAPFNEDQVIMSQEDSTCEVAKVEEHFGIQLAAFEPTLEGYAKRL